jgi:hypothetical protein
LLWSQKKKFEKNRREAQNRRMRKFWVLQRLVHSSYRCPVGCANGTRNRDFMKRNY